MISPNKITLIIEIFCLIVNVMNYPTLQITLNISLVRKVVRKILQLYIEMFTIRPQKQTKHIFCPVYAKCQERQVTAARLNIIFTKYLVLLSFKNAFFQSCPRSKLPPSPLSAAGSNCIRYFHFSNSTHFVKYF